MKKWMVCVSAVSLLAWQVLSPIGLAQETPLAQQGEVEILQPAEPTIAPAAEPMVEPKAAPTAEPTAEPMAEPTAEPMAEPTAEPTAEPMAEPTDAFATEPVPGSQDEPTQEPTPAGDQTTEPVGESEAPPAAEPSETPEAEPTTAPEEEGTPVPTTQPGEQITPSAEPAPEPTAEPTWEATTTPQATGEAWVQNGEQRQYGKVAELLESGLGMIYVTTWEVVELPQSLLTVLSAAQLSPDREIFPDPQEVVILSLVNPQGLTKGEIVFLWVGKAEEASKASDSLNQVEILPDEAVLEAEIRVEAVDFTPGTACSPTFQLTAAPALAPGQAFAVSVNGSEPQVLSGSSFTPSASGEYRFSLVSAQGEVLARSAKYQVILAEATPDPTPDPTPEPTLAPTPEPTPEFTAEPTAEPPVLLMAAAPVGQSVAEAEIMVAAADYYPGVKSDIAPVFTLSGGGEGQAYGVRVDEGSVERLAGSVYTAAEAGEYTLRFVIVDSQDTVLASSVKYTLNLDFSTESAIRKQAWMLNEQGEKIYGTMAGLLGQTSADGKIYLQTAETIVLNQGAAALSGITLLPDPGIFASGRYLVKVSDQNPAEVSSVSGQLYVWVQAAGSASGAVEAQLTVTAANYLGSGWHSQAPAFTLACPEGEALGLSYAVQVDEGTPVTLSTGVFTPRDEGSYILTFCLVDGQGQVIVSSQAYPLRLDTTAPQILATARGSGLTLTCQDAGSGLAAFSLDGGTTWTKLEGIKAYSATFTYSDSLTFAAGSIQVKDLAGHVAATQEAAVITVQAAGSASRPGGSGGTTRTTSHAASDTETVIAYNGVALLIEEETMTQLTLGGETLAVTLTIAEESQGSDYAPAFTARLAAWNGRSGDPADTLILTAVTEPEQDHAYRWQFNGMAYKKLAASGIDYLVFQVGDQMTALSTAGFTAGMRYNLYKAAGLGSSAFGYELVMAPAQALMDLYLSVEGATYQVAAQADAELYYYDLYTGNQDMMNQAFGAWPA